MHFKRGGMALCDSVSGKDEVMLTVKMLAYNHEKYIAKAIESILSQKTEYRFELLIGEDCSTDHTKAIIEQYAKRYPDIIRPIYQERNVGCTRNSYTLDIEARGKYIAGCEGDDFWCDDTRIQRDVDFLEAHAEFSGVCHKCIVVDDDGDVIPQEHISDRMAFWRFHKEVYSLQDFEQWMLPGHGSARTGRNVIRGHEEECSIVYEASGRVGDRTHILLQVIGGDIYCMGDVVSCYRYRTRIDNSNFMALQQNKNLRDEEFIMLCRLEKWAKDKKGVYLNLEKIKKDRLAGSTVVLLKKPSRENVGVVFRIIKNSEKPIRYTYYFIKAICLKAYYLYVRKEDKLLEL